MVGSYVSSDSRPTLRKATSRTALAAILLMIMVPTAKAQGLLYFFDPPQQRIERQLEAAGYELSGPLVRRGDVYVCDVFNDTGGRERLVIDARTAQILERYRTRAQRWREDRFGDWRDRDGNDAWDMSPRPPRAMTQVPLNGNATNGRDDFGSPPRSRPRDDVARADPYAKPPTVITGQDGPNSSSTEEVDKPKAKPHIAKKKPAAAGALAKASPPTAPVAEGAAIAPPADSSATPNPVAGEGAKPVSPPANARAATPKPVVEARPAVDTKSAVEAKPLAEANPVAEARPVADEKPATEAKPVSESKPLTEAKSAPAPEPHVEKKSKAVNDVPVNPLD